MDNQKNPQIENPKPFSFNYSPYIEFGSVINFLVTFSYSELIVISQKF